MLGSRMVLASILLYFLGLWLIPLEQYGMLWGMSVFGLLLLGATMQRMAVLTSPVTLKSVSQEEQNQKKDRFWLCMGIGLLWAIVTGKGR